MPYRGQTIPADLSEQLLGRVDYEHEKALSNSLNSCAGREDSPQYMNRLT